MVTQVQYFIAVAISIAFSAIPFFIPGPVILWLMSREADEARKIAMSQDFSFAPSPCIEIDYALVEAEIKRLESEDLRKEIEYMIQESERRG